MSIKKRFLHFVYAIKNSVIYGIIGIILCVISLCAIIHTPENNNVTSFFIGIVASIIATLIFKITDKYANSIVAHNSIFVHIEKLLTFIEFSTSSDNYVIENCQLELFDYYISICEKSHSLTYVDDFLEISKAINDLIDCIIKKESKEKINIQKSEIEKIKNKYNS